MTHFAVSDFLLIKLALRKMNKFRVSNGKIGLILFDSEIIIS